MIEPFYAFLAVLWLTGEAGLIACRWLLSLTWDVEGE